MCDSMYMWCCYEWYLFDVVWNDVFWLLYFCDCDNKFVYVVCYIVLLTECVNIDMVNVFDLCVIFVWIW